MEITGLPLHPLVVHAAVVLGPPACAAALAYVAVPRWRDWLRWPIAVAVVLATGAIWAAYLTGGDLFESDRFATVQGELRDKILRHEELAGYLRWVTSGFAAAALGAVAVHRRPGAVKVILGVLVAVGAIATLVLTVLTGDAGSRAVWEI